METWTRSETASSLLLTLLCLLYHILKAGRDRWNLQDLDSKSSSLISYLGNRGLWVTPRAPAWGSPKQSTSIGGGGGEKARSQRINRATVLLKAGEGKIGSIPVTWKQNRWHGIGRQGSPSRKSNKTGECGARLARGGFQAPAPTPGGPQDVAPGRACVLGRQPMQAWRHGRTVVVLAGVWMSLLH